MNPIDWLISKVIKTLIKRGVIKKHTGASCYTTREYFEAGQYLRGNLVCRALSLIDPSFHLDATFLDLGCGLGGKTFFLAEKYGCNAIGLDCDVELLLSAKGILKDIDEKRRIRFVCASTDALPFRDNSISKIISTDSFEHVAKPLEVLKETGRCLKSKDSSAWFIFNPFLSPRGAHSWPPIPLPWANTFLSDSSISELTALVEEHESISYLDLRHLNKMSLSRCRCLVSQVEFGVKMYTISLFDRMRIIGRYLKLCEVVDWIKERTTWVVILKIIR
jgi:ubiquinone/menaquinone biosynthesis C-methylase UbiE